MEAAAQTDSEIARRIAAFETSRALLGEFSRARLKPVPAEFEDLVRETLHAARDEQRSDSGPARSLRSPSKGAARGVVAGGGRRRRGADRGRGRRHVAVVRGDGGQGGLRAASLESSEIWQVLGTEQSGTRTAVQGGEFAAIASFLSAGGECCREFDRADSGTAVSVACRTDDGWQLRFAVVTAGAPDAGFVPASSLETLDAYPGAIGAGAPLSLGRERQPVPPGALHRTAQAGLERGGTAIVAHAALVSKIDLQAHPEEDDSFRLLKAYGRMKGVACRVREICV